MPRTSSPASSSLVLLKTPNLTTYSFGLSQRDPAFVNTHCLEMSVPALTNFIVSLMLEAIATCHGQLYGIASLPPDRLEDVSGFTAGTPHFVCACTGEISSRQVQEQNTERTINRERMKQVNWFWASARCISTTTTVTTSRYFRNGTSH